MPWPADYGGVMDLFYKLPALKAEGVAIHLHCFDYGRGVQPELERHCHSVHYYERNLGHKGVSNTLPYIVSSRKSDALLQRLLKDDHPVLMEGIHCSFLLTDPRFNARRCFVRLHNVEFQYYRDLFSSSPNFLKKLYYLFESRLLKSYEKKIASRSGFWAVTQQDAATYREKLDCHDVRYLPVFIPHWELSCQEGMGNYCLYHGDLSVDANEKAALWLIEKIFSKVEVPFVIMGKSPSKKLAAAAKANGHTCLVADPGDKELEEVIAKAHINLVPAFTGTGIKLKLINALFHGRHCVVNETAVNGSGLEPACHIGTTANAFREIIAQLYHQPFTGEEIELRRKLLGRMFDNAVNAKRVVEFVWPSSQA